MVKNCNYLHIDEFLFTLSDLALRELFYSYLKYVKEQFISVCTYMTEKLNFLHKITFVVDIHNPQKIHSTATTDFGYH